MWPVDPIIKNRIIWALLKGRVTSRWQGFRFEGVVIWEFPKIGDPNIVP